MTGFGFSAGNVSGEAASAFLPLSPGALLGDSVEPGAAVGGGVVAGEVLFAASPDGFVTEDGVEAGGTESEGAGWLDAGGVETGWLNAGGAEADGLVPVGLALVEGSGEFCVVADGEAFESEESDDSVAAEGLLELFPNHPKP
jgi:hypothetical protein